MTLLDWKFAIKQRKLRLWFSVKSGSSTEVHMSDIIIKIQLYNEWLPSFSWYFEKSKIP